jgi:hypothetical protein
MIGGLQGNWALILVLYAVLAILAIAAHIVWAWRIGRKVWHSGRSHASKLALMTLAAATPVVGFYVAMELQRRRHASASAESSAGGLIMPAIGLCTVGAGAVRETLRYTPDGRSLAAMVGFIPGFLTYYVLMQLILFMAASVFGFSRGDFLVSRTHLLSAAILLATALFLR